MITKDSASRRFSIEAFEAASPLGLLTKETVILRGEVIGTVLQGVEIDLERCRTHEVSLFGFFVCV
jgi:hypothetical protein